MNLSETSLLGHDRIGTEQILLALINDRESTGARLQGDVLPVDVDQLREHILRHVTEHRLTAELGSGPTHVQHTTGCRMEYLRRQLDDPGLDTDFGDGGSRCGRCDNCCAA